MEKSVRCLRSSKLLRILHSEWDMMGGKRNPGLERTAEERWAKGMRTRKQKFEMRQGDLGACVLTEVVSPQMIHYVLLF